MKRLGLFPTLLSATLFLAIGLTAQEAAPAAPATTAAPATSVSPAKKLSDRDAALIKRFDKNGDGKLDQDELAAAHETMRERQMERAEGIAPQARAKLLERFDANHDGKLDDDERAAMRKTLAQTQEIFRTRMMERFDANHDGKLDETERAAARQALEDFFVSLDQPK